MKRTINRDIANREINLEDEVWSKIRSQLYVFYLTYWREIKGNLRKAK